MDLDHERRLTEVEQRAKSNTKRLDELEQRQDDMDALTASIATMATKQAYIEDDVKEIKDDVKTLTEKPAKRWDGVVDTVLCAILAAAVAFALGRLGL